MLKRSASLTALKHQPRRVFVVKTADIPDQGQRPDQFRLIQDVHDLHRAFFQRIAENAGRVRLIGHRRYAVVIWIVNSILSPDTTLMAVKSARTGMLPAAAASNRPHSVMARVPVAVMVPTCWF